MRPIDADALIEKCGDWYVDECTESGFIGTLKDLLATEQTIQPDPKWIPCELRMPTRKDHTDDMVLVCYGNGSVRFNTCMDGEWVQGNPIAWMPLPEPYKPNNK